MPNALLIKLPQDSSAVRSPSSDRLYHFESRKREPGKNAASTKPRKKRVSRAPVKLVVMPSCVFETMSINSMPSDDALTGEDRYCAPDHHADR